MKDAYNTEKSSTTLLLSMIMMMRYPNVNHTIARTTITQHQLTTIELLNNLNEILEDIIP